MKNDSSDTGPVMKRNGPTSWAMALLAAALSFLVYLPALKNNFVNWDDPYIILKNVHIRSLDPSSLWWMFTSFYQGFWMPLTWFSLALDYRWGGLEPGTYHFHNLVLHALNTGLVFFLSLKIIDAARGKSNPGEIRGKTDWTVTAAFGTALLFALHPIHAETVAWATGRKDLLCGLFFLSSLLVYLAYVQPPGRKAWKYWACLLLFFLALLSKPMAVTLPLVLLLLDGWPLGRFQNERFRVLREKIPFFILAFGAGVLTVLAESQVGALAGLGRVPLDLRILNAFHSLAFYLWKMAVPLDLAAFYPAVTGPGVFSPGNLASVFLVILAGWACFYYRHKRPFLAAAGLFYVMTLAPVLGIVQIGGHAAADRYTYLPSLAPFLLLASFAASVFAGRSRLKMFLAAVLFAVLASATVRQAGVWKDSITLWENSIKSHPSAEAYSNLGDAYWKAGRKDDALLAYDRAIALDEFIANPHNGKGIAFLKAGQLEQAAREFKTAMALNPHDAVAHCSLGDVDWRAGRRDDAISEYDRAIALDASFASPHDGKGIAFLKTGQLEQAAREFRTAIALNAQDAVAHCNLGVVIYAQNGKPESALEEIQKGIRIDPAIVSAYGNLGRIYMAMGNFEEAIKAFQKARSLEPGNPVYARDLAEANRQAASHRAKISKP
jgi:tetratricopeptide (TPR) repeat protein